MCGLGNYIWTNKKEKYASSINPFTDKEQTTCDLTLKII